MTLLRVKTIEAGVRGQSITVRGSSPPEGSRSYDQEAEMELDLPQARELHRLLGKLIRLAEQSRLSAPVVALQAEKDSA